MSRAAGEEDEAAGEAGQAPDQHQAARTDQAWRKAGASEAGTRVELGHSKLCRLETGDGDFVDLLSCGVLISRILAAASFLIFPCTSHCFSFFFA